MQKKFKIHGLATVFSGLILTGCGSDNDNQQTTPQPVSKAVELNILHINDHHSHLDAEEWTFKFDRGQGQEDFTVSRGGFARVAGLMHDISAQKSNVLKLHGGDAMTGDLYFNLTEGKADAVAMNTACFDSFVLGNHEFDAKDLGLKKFVDFLGESKCENPLSIISANVQFGATSALKGDARIQSHRIFERGGEKFAVIGLTIANKTKNSSQPDADTLFLDEIKTAQAQIDQLKKQGISRIILQTHVGYEFDQKLAQALTDVDVIVGGDSHTLLGPESLKQVGLSPSGAYPTQVTNKNGDPVCIAQAWQYSYVVGELNVKFDPQGKVTACAGTPHVLVGSEIKKGDQTLTHTESAFLFEKLNAAQIPLKAVNPYAETVAALASYQKDKAAFAQKEIAIASNDLCLRRVPGLKIDPNRSKIASCNTDPAVIQRGGDIQQLVAEAFYQQGKTYFGADLSIQNGGGVRIDIAKNDVVNVATVYTVLPFKNTLVRLDMTGAEVKATLEDAISNVVDPEVKNSGSYPYAGGLRWKVDVTKPKGSRLTALEVKGANGQYQPLDMQKTYRVITIDFLANGQDGYSTMKNITGERRMDVGLDYAEAFLTYVQNLNVQNGQLKSLNKLTQADYSTQSYTE